MDKMPKTSKYVLKLHYVPDNPWIIGGFLHQYKEAFRELQLIRTTHGGTLPKDYLTELYQTPWIKLDSVFAASCAHEICKFAKNHYDTNYAYVAGKKGCGNPKFEIIKENAILFKPDRKHHSRLTIPNMTDDLKEMMRFLRDGQDHKNFSIGVRIDDQFIYLMFSTRYFQYYPGNDLNKT